MYLSRTIEQILIKYSSFFPVVLVTGARQVGKTTLLQHCTHNDRTYITLDDPSLRELAERDPVLFFQRFTFPLIIDEIQYAPNLFSYIKIIVDKEQKPGLFWLTGSQHFNVMKNVTESLAGRIGILPMSAFTRKEKYGTQESDPFDSDFFRNIAFAHEKENYLSSQLQEIFRDIWLGFYPRLVCSDDYSLHDAFYESYLQTYLERDVYCLFHIGQQIDFVCFMKALAARTGQILNYSDLARDIGVTVPTIKSWCSILQASDIIFFLQPYYENLNKRIVKTPKIYFSDTGLAAYLSGWSSPESLMNGAMAGAYFETFVIGEIRKKYLNHGKIPPIFYYRDQSKKEIDLIIEEKGLLFPIEIKLTGNPSQRDIKHFSVLSHKLGKPIGAGAVVCMSQTHYPLTESVNVIPVGCL